jgi:hypothetical protein
MPLRFWTIAQMIDLTRAPQRSSRRGAPPHQRRPLTPCQRRALRAIHDHGRQHDRWPTRALLARLLGIAPTSCDSVITALLSRGMARSEWTRAGSVIALTSMGQKLFEGLS